MMLKIPKRQSETNAHCRLTTIHAHHQIDEEEDSDGNDHEGEEEVAALALLVVKELNYDPVDQEAEKKSQQSVGKASRK